jgi:hypothetical protein
MKLSNGWRPADSRAGPLQRLDDIFGTIAELGIEHRRGRRRRGSQWLQDIVGSVVGCEQR